MLSIAHMCGSLIGMMMNQWVFGCPIFRQNPADQGSLFVRDFEAGFILISMTICMDLYFWILLIYVDLRWTYVTKTCAWIHDDGVWWHMMTGDWWEIMSYLLFANHVMNNLEGQGWTSQEGPCCGGRWKSRSQRQRPGMVSHGPLSLNIMIYILYT